MQEFLPMKHFKFFNLLFLIASITCLGKQYQPCGKIKTQYSSLRQKKKLFSCVGCQYLNFVEIDFADFFSIDPKATEHYLNSKEMIHKLSKKYYSKVINYDLAPMYLQWISQDIGYGVFAQKNIAKNDFIGAYTGEIRLMRNSTTQKTEDVDYAWYYPINAPSGAKLLIDGKFKGNELRFINHDQNPNTKCIDVLINGMFYLCYIATKDIAKGTQLTISYGDGYWDSRKINPENIK